MVLPVVPTQQKSVSDWDANEVLEYLLRCDWADPEFVKRARLHKLDGRSLLNLTKQDLRSIYGIQELGTIKHYLREIRDLDPQWHAETARLNALQFADLDEKDKLQTPTPSFLPDVRACQSPGMSGSVMSMSGGPSVSVLDRPLTSSPCSSVPPRVTTLEEYNAYRRQNGAERPLSPAQRQINKDHIAAPSYVGQSDADREAVRQMNEELEVQQQRFKERMSDKLEEAFKRFDREGKGFLKTQQLESLIKEVFPSFKPSMVLEYKDVVLGENWKAGAIVGRISMVLFRDAMLRKLLMLESAFRIMDRDGSGEVEYTELEALVEVLMPMQAPKEKKAFARKIVQDCDSSGEGRISLDEFVMSQYANTLAGPAELELKRRKRRARLEELFATVDADKTGSISHAELKQLLDNVFADFSDREKDTYRAVIIAECDKDNSGAIEFEEFVQSEYATTMLDQEEEDEEEASRSAPTDSMSMSMSMSRATNTLTAPSFDDAASVTTMDESMVSANFVEQQYDPCSPEAARLRRKQRELEEQEMKDAGLSPRGRAMARERQKKAAAAARQNRAAEARRIMQKDSRKQKVGMSVGILEKERRYTCIKELFECWDKASDASRDGSGRIEEEELRAVLKKCYDWTDDEAHENVDAILDKIDKDRDGTLDFDEFFRFVDDFTGNVTVQTFDKVINFMMEAVAAYSKEQERKRRTGLLQTLFREWDADGSGVLDMRELYQVITRFNDEERDGGEQETVKLMVTAADADGDGTLDMNEFVDYFNTLTRKMTHNTFDLMLYRFSRCIEEVQTLQMENTAGTRYKQLLLNSLERYEILELLEDCDPTIPLLLFGTACDPSRAIEKSAKEFNVPCKAFLVSHERAERLALAGLQKYGFKLGYWVYFLMARDYPNAHPFLRQVGIAMQTSHKSHPRFRLWVWNPVQDRKDFPEVLSTNARFESLDEIDPEDRGLSTRQLKDKFKKQLGQVGLRRKNSGEIIAYR